MPLNVTMNLHVIYIGSSETVISMLSVIKHISYMLSKHHVLQKQFNKQIDLIVKGKISRVIFHGLYFNAHLFPLNSLCDKQFKSVFIKQLYLLLLIYSLCDLQFVQPLTTWTIFAKEYKKAFLLFCITLYVWSILFWHI